MRGLAAAAALALALAACGRPPTPRPAVDFTLSDVDGRPVTLSDFRGKVVLLDFWATWCSPCIEEIPYLKDLHARSEGKGFTVLAVSLDNLSAAEIRGFARKTGMPYPVLVTGGRDVAGYRIPGIPMAFLIDREGTILREYRGMKDPGQVNSDVAAELGRPPPDVRDAPAEEPSPAHSRRNPMKQNRLSKEKSPYLLQHAYNPVDWYPWGEEAFEKARREDKPLLLSIGYSTCHWCHVMERESFSDPDVAAVLNEHFVAIKVDREERPDVDRIYMTAVQAMTGQGGWPLNVFLTPDLKPFYGGTYFPPDGRYGRPGFTRLLQRIAEHWRSRRKELAADAETMAKALGEQAAARSGGVRPEAAWLEGAFKSFRASFDARQGGFGGAPKFPMPVNLGYLLRYSGDAGPEAASMVRRTLEAMALGGIHDHVGGGFHRYSTDARWHVPHFEKMLYDNAQLAAVYLEAFQLTKEPMFAQVARSTLDYVLRDLRHPDGGFYSAEDADSLPPENAAKGTKHAEKREGAFYVWTEAELRGLLGADAGLFSARFGVKPDGNALEDPQGEFAGRNVLFAARTVEEAAQEAGVPAGEAAGRLETTRLKLLAARSKRPRPGLDDKVLTSWNGLMLSALAKGAQVLGEPKYREAGETAARFLKAKLLDAKTGRLYHRWRDGERAVPGLADDYAFLAQGLIDLFETDADPEWLEWALALADAEERLFRAPRGGYFMTAEGHDPNLLVRVVEDSDNVEPAASSVAALNLLRLWRLTGRRDFDKSARETLAAFGAQMRDQPRSLPAMLSALAFATAPSREVVVLGEPGDTRTRALLDQVHARFLPSRVLLVAGAENRARLERLAPWLKQMQAKTPTAFVCTNYACELPTSDPSELGRLLDAAGPS